MPNTPIAGLRYPDLTSAPNVPLDVGNLAADLDAKVTVTVANTSARNALVNKYDGMRIYEAASKRYYRWDASAGFWFYVGGAPPSIATLSLSSGWSAPVNFAPGCYKNASGEICVVGGVTNNSSYTPVGNNMLFLPAGFWPTRDIAVTIMAPAGDGLFLGGVYAADGAIKINLPSTAAIPAGTLHTVNFRFHPGFAGGALT